jgi:uncharacterized membrane protein
MKPLYVLTFAFILAIAGLWLWSQEWRLVLAGNIAMAAMLLFTAMGHFMFTPGMVRMMPPVIPFRRELVWLTGLAEIAGAVGLLLPQYRHLAAGWLIVFLLLVLPVNIYAALHRVDYQKGTSDGAGPEYLWIRIPLQVFFIGWIWFFSW